MSLRLFLTGFACCCVLMFSNPVKAATDRPNILLIAVDDLRPALGCFGDTTAVTPEIDRLAARGMTFSKAYCQLAVCSPSRLSLLTGLRPDTIKVWDLQTHFRETVPDAVTLPQHFRDHGYHTRSIGKIFHGSGTPSKDPPSWSKKPQLDHVRDPQLRYSLPQNLQGSGLKRASTEAADVPDNSYADGIACDLAVAALAELRKQQQPFFLAVGFRKPHLPFCAPQTYWDLYDRDAIPLPAFVRHPVGAPELATRSWNELEGYRDIPTNGQLTVAKSNQLRHGYYACVSYIDAQVGRLLDTLDRLQLTDRTIIVLLGDHGFHLGEQGLWTKANNYELSTRVPLIISVPGIQNSGTRCNRAVEFVDIFPTLAEVCSLPVPTDLEGVSMQPLLQNPHLAWKTAVFSQYPRPQTGSRYSGRGDIMGYAVRTQHFRYVEWQDNASGRLLAAELYDHRTDANETQNLAPKPESAAILQQHAKILRAGWRDASPLQQGVQP